MWKIYAPVKDANGVWASVRFVNGVGETKNPALVEWFRQHGYRVEKCDELPQKTVEKCDAFNLVIEPKNDQIEVANDQIEPDFDSMTPLELREWAKANGLGGVIKNTRNKEKLLELIRG